MRDVPVPALIALLRKRGGPLDNDAFIDGFSDFVRACLDDREAYDAGPYYEWVIRKLAIQGRYGKITSVARIASRLVVDKSLVFSIQRYGIKKPLLIWCDEYGIEIDGWHRAVIAAVLGLETVPCRLAGGNAWPAELQIET
jgi:hypothetical protein